MASRFSLLVALAPVLLHSVYGQTTDANCTETYDWMRNTIGQSPCLMTAWLNIPCSPGGWSVGALPQGQLYPAPSNTTTSPCRCSSVTYSMLAACAICQNHPDGNGIVDWPSWIANCPADQISVDKYPEEIPKETRIPAWAYLDLQSNGKFDVDAALAVAQQRVPESTAPGSTTLPGSATASVTSHSSTTSPSGGSFTFGSETSDPATSETSKGAPPTQGADASQSSKHSNVGPIVGGVVGGILGLLALGGLAFFLIRRSRARGAAATAAYTPAMADVQYANAGGYGGGGAMYSPGLEAEKAGSVPLLYNPNDPRTFPTNYANEPSYEGPQSLHTGSVTMQSSGDAGHASFYPSAPAPPSAATGGNGFIGRPEISG